MRPCLCFLVACSYSPSELTTGPGDSAQTVDTAPLACPEGFTTLPDTTSMYRASPTPRAYDAAIADCASLDPRVHLLRIDSQAEVDGAMTLASGLVRVVGHRHLNNGADPFDDTWHDLDDVTELNFLPWGANEPTSLAGEICMVIRDENFGNPPAEVAGAQECTSTKPYICECE